MRAISVDGLAQPQRSDPGLPPQLEWLPIELLVIDPEYQRDVKRDGRRSIERIAAEFSWSKFSTVVVSPIGTRGGEPTGEQGNETIYYAIIDGQHRTTAAKLCGYDRVPCQILRLDKAGQAASFAAINGAVTKITSWALYKAAVAAESGWAAEARAVTEAANVKLMTYNQATTKRVAGEIYGVFTIRDLIQKHGSAAVTLALSAYRQSVYGDLPVAWGNTFLWAWIASVAAVPELAALPAEQLARFHDGFDVFAADDHVVETIRQARRDGIHPPAHWAALSAALIDGLKSFAQSARAAA